MLMAIVFMRIASLGILAVPTTPHTTQVEVTHTAMARIVRHEQPEPNSLMQEEAEEMHPDPLELEPAMMGGDGGSTTTIVLAGSGPTTTAIWLAGFAPGPSTHPNAKALEPIYEPGAPGPPGVAGPPGPPGDPGPPEGGGAKSIKPFVHHDAGGSQTNYEARGDPGVVGARGHHGYEGEAGSRGLMGELGHRGHLGPPGPKGERGPAGKPNHANAAKFSWFMIVIGINSVFTLVVFFISYREFVHQKEARSEQKDVF